METSQGSEKSAALPVCPSLVTQTFAANALDRSTTLRRKPEWLRAVLPDSRFLLTTGRTVVVRRKEGGPSEVVYFTCSELAEFGLQLSGDHFIAGSQGDINVFPYLLGEEKEQPVWVFALDAMLLPAESLKPNLERKGLELVELRSLMPLLPMSEIAVAGQAVALAQWHQTHMFCGRCGALTQPIEAGGKRQCQKDSRHRFYPRTDPVAIMLVESVNGDKALLGRSKKMFPGMLTCLSGFIEQGESIEEAVSRELQEEAGVQVGAISILGSQPWPIGRAGGCELMIGAIAKATDDTLHVNYDEMDDVRWVTRSEVLTAVENAARPSNPYLGGTGNPTQEGGLDFWIPAPYAIAHHLIKTWASSSRPWFARL